MASETLQATAYDASLQTAQPGLPAACGFGVFGSGHLHHYLSKFQPICQEGFLDLTP